MICLKEAEHWHNFRNFDRILKKINRTNEEITF